MVSKNGADGKAPCLLTALSLLMLGAGWTLVVLPLVALAYGG